MRASYEVRYLSSRATEKPILSRRKPYPACLWQLGANAISVASSLDLARHLTFEGCMNRIGAFETNQWLRKEHRRTGSTGIHVQHLIRWSSSRGV